MHPDEDTNTTPEPETQAAPKHVHARFYVADQKRFWSWNNKDAMTDQFHLSGVQGEPFGSATPSASMDMVIANPEAAKLFQKALESNRPLDVVFSLAPEGAK